MSRYSVHAREQREDREAVGHMMDLGNRPTPRYSLARESGDDLLYTTIENLWDPLRELLDRTYDRNLTHANAVEGIKKGIGHEFVSKLRRVARKDKDALYVVMPREIVDAICSGKPKR